MLQAGRSRVRFSIRSLDFSIDPITEMSIRNLPGGKGRPERKADSLTAICEPTVYKMWGPRRLKALWASTACDRDSFTCLHFYLYRL
jgi:hypothetical protein